MRMGQTFGLISGAVLVCGLLLSEAATAQPSTAERERALELFRKGNEAFATGDVEAALAAYEASWKISRSFDIACNLGRAEAELGRSRDAAEHLAFCLEHFTASSRSELREAESKFRSLMQDVERRVGELHLDVKPAGTEVAVDAELVGKAPIARRVFVEPGLHVIEARGMGLSPEQRSVDVRAGQRVSVKIELAPEPDPEPVTDAKSQAPHRADGEPSGGAPTLVLLGGAAISAIGIGIGVGLAVDAKGRRDDAATLTDRAHDQVSGGCPSSSSQAICIELREALAFAEQREDAATALFIGSSAVGLAALVAWLVWPSATPTRGTPPGAVALSPELGSDRAIMNLVGGF